MSDQKSKARPPEVFAASLARLAGAWLGVLAFWVTHLAALLHGVRQPTALVRAAVTGVVFYVCGRILGSFLGRSLAANLVRESVPAADEGGSTS